MKKCFFVIALFVLPLLCWGQDNEIRAVWLTTLNGLDWPRTKATNAASMERQKKELTDMLDKLKAVNINTILFQTRIRGSVVYPSELQPWDHCLTGTPGRSPGYDPLRFAIDECHKRGMECHAWVVTLPLGKWNENGCRQMRKKYPQVVKRVGENGFLNPEDPRTPAIVAEICGEIVEKYDVDGIHLDYARYPDGWTIRVSRPQGRQYITQLVRAIHDRVKAVRPEVKMSCSPVGKFKDLTRYSSRGWNAFDKVCQDAQGWLRDGLMDQLYPMLYFKENNFFPFAIDWAEQRQGKEVAAGLGIWFLDPREGNWKIGEVMRQLNVIRQLGLGQCHFRARFLIDNHQGLYDYLRVFNFPECWPDGSQFPMSRVPYPADEEPSDVPTLPEVSMQKAARGGFPLLRSNGDPVQLTSVPSGLDARAILVTSLTGNRVASLPWNGGNVSVASLPDGAYTLSSVSKNGATHRLAMLMVKRKLKK
ncbi:MAG: family 10 glycosylhydrolase [Prevotella sp.]|nr:family 10 glycosylhydrolase [Prevotella sp.]